eukprot:GHRR01023916.1.p1 GENE.GHRR01023916.1~~GHRR01023916.1.p1  ORF type:complete len:223 (+),score=77.35 GHRR01023916.1:1200-1868(+)
MLAACDAATHVLLQLTPPFLLVTSVQHAGEAEPEGWNAALADFDTAQDAAQPAAAAAEDQPTPPSREELERAAALALVRFDEEDSGGTIEVADAPPDEQYIPRTFEEQIQNLSVQDKEALTKNRQAYASFPMDGIDLLVSETPDGRINLADCFILDRDEELFARPTVQEGIPVEPRMYQLLPWEHTKTGDILKRIDPKVTVSMVEDVCFNTGLCLLQFRPIW